MCSEQETHLTVSESGIAVIRQELDITLDPRGKNLPEFLDACDRLLDVEITAQVNAFQAMERASKGLLQVHHYKDYFTPIASGSFLTAGMVVCPCSGSTLSGIANAASNNLIQRAADVHLKEHRKLVVVPRETPLSAFQLENMHRLAVAGAVVLPAAPGWYHGATKMLDLVDFVVGRILDQFEIENQLIQRWTE